MYACIVFTVYTNVHTYVRMYYVCAMCVRCIVSVRLTPLQNTASLGVSRVRWLVLDEADRLMEMGFSANIHTIVSLLEEKKVLDRRRRNVLLSATLSKGEGGEEVRTVMSVCQLNFLFSCWGSLRVHTTPAVVH